LVGGLFLDDLVAFDANPTEVAVVVMGKVLIYCESILKVVVAI
jgi:hypothetical protein